MASFIRSERVWTCARGRTRLLCDLRCECEDDVALHVTRNDRLYGEYRFAGRIDALAFAARLRDTFASNGWVRDDACGERQPALG